MNLKTTYILFSILGLILVLFILALWMGPQKEPSAYVLARMHEGADPIETGQVDEIIIERERPKQEKWVFQRQPETNRWVITEPRHLRGNNRTINSLLQQLYSAQRDKTTDKPADLAQWGLNPPAETITLKRGETEVQLKVGDVNEGTRYGTIYVLPGDRPKEPMAVRKSQLSDVLQDLGAYRETELLTAAESDITEVKLSETDKGKPKSNPVELVKNTTKNRWYYEKPFSGDADVEGDTGVPPPGSPPNGIRGLLTELTNLKVDYTSEKQNDFVEDDVKDFAKYNLDESKDEVLRIEIKRIDEIKTTRESNKDKKDKDKKEGEAEPKKEVKTSTITVLVGVGKKLEGDKYYARRTDEKDVVKVSAKNVDPLLKLLATPDALRDRHLIRVDDPRKVDAIIVKNDYLLEFFKPDPEKSWQFYRGNDKQSSNDQVITGLLNLLKDRNKDISFLDIKTTKEADVGLDKPAAVVSVWVEGLAKEEKKEEKEEEKKDEKKDAKKDKKDEKKEEKPAKPKLKAPEKPTFRLTFAAPKSSKAEDVVVKREAEGEDPALLRVPKHIYERVMEGPLFYLNTKLPQFNPSEFDATKNVTRLTIEQAGTATEVVKESQKDKPDTWKIVKPSDLKDRKADPQVIQSILRNLNDLHAIKLVAEEASKTDLDKKYGLQSPAIKAVITVDKDGKKTDYEYDFGKEEGPAGLYARQSQRGMIFVADKSIVSTLKEPLLDKTVFQFDVTKVKTVKLTGWQKLLGTPFILEVERKDANEWTVKTPPKFPLDSARINNLLTDLSNLRLQKFLAHNAKPEPKQELDPEKGGMLIEITVEGEAKPLRLTIGKAEDGGYVAVSDQLPGDIFTISKTAAIDGMLEKPKYFSP